MNLQATPNRSVLPYLFASWTENGLVQSAATNYSFPAVRNRQLVPSPLLADALQRAADTLRLMIEDIDHSGEVESSHHLRELHSLAGEAKPALA